MTFRSARRATLFALASLALATTVSAGLFSADPPADLNLALDRQTADGLYAVALSPVTVPVTVGQMHAWTVRLTDAKGQPVKGAAIAISGGMPQHGHGLPSAPAVTQDMGDGRYLIEGMKFNMPGWWEIDLGIKGPTGFDTVTFNILL